MSQQNANSAIPWQAVRRITALGEPLLELQPAAGQQVRASFGGDVANAMVCMARLIGGRGKELSLATALGTSSYSAWLRSQLQREGLHVIEPAGQAAGEPGIYGLPLMRNGGPFSYWRSHSAARQFLGTATVGDLEQLLGEPDLLLITGVTLALCSAASYTALCQWTDQHAQHCSVVFDTNYRPALWPSADLARERIGAFARRAAVVATGLEDERALWQIENGSEIIARLGAMPAETLIRAGAQGCHLYAEGRLRHVAAVAATVIDTAGAGDAHLAGYLCARLAGCEPESAAHYAAAVAALIIGQMGSVARPELNLPPLPVR